MTESTDRNPVETLREFHDNLTSSINGAEGENAKNFCQEHIAYTISLVGLAICYQLEKLYKK